MTRKGWSWVRLGLDENLRWFADCVPTQVGLKLPELQPEVELRGPLPDPNPPAKSSKASFPPFVLSLYLLLEREPTVEPHHLILGLNLSKSVSKF